MTVPLFKVHMPDSVVDAVKATLLSGYIGQGPKVDEFEKALIPWIGHPNILSVNSGTSALYLALRLAGVGVDDEVISTPMTCMATNTPIMDHKAKVVWADIDPWTGNIDPTDVERKITPRTRAVLAVHWGGYPCDLNELLRVTRKYGVPLIEDAAHAFGAVYQGRKIGSISQFTCFSFQAIKHLTTVDGGALVVATNEGYRRGKLLRWYGIDRETPRRDLRCEDDVVEAGGKMHMNDVAATIGLEQLKYVQKILDAHRANAGFYDEHLDGLRGIKKLRYSKDRLSSYWLYTIRVDDQESFYDHMAKHGVMVSKVHVRNDSHTCFKAFRKNLPGVDEFSSTEMSIPVGWWVTGEERSKIVEEVRAWDRSR
jgi:dTDP-4-amino-4,6-dideoxygalactose transaminase